jgi:four helix bundle protein
MRIERFEDVIAWRKAGELSFKIYNVFKNCKDYGFNNQIQRASVSVMNNIAEGFERKGNKEFKYFLYVAKGSCGEVRSMLYLGLKLNYLDSYNFRELYNLSLEVSRLISGFVKTL